jgi:RimJ/RimL family protein N-acetyltransferase
MSEPQTWPFPEPDVKVPPAVFSGEGQTFLVGDTIFLRGVEEEDARRAAGWRDSPYPINAERAGEIIREMTEDDTPGSRFLVACRRSDGLPVGSVSMSRSPNNDPYTETSLYADPALPGAGQVRAEALELLVRWGFGEAELPNLLIEFGAHETGLRAHADTLGFLHDATTRQHTWHGGAFHDTLTYTAYNPAWHGRYGTPEPGIRHAMAVEDPARWRPREYPTFGTLDGDPPLNAVMVGPRVYLRPLELTDAPGVIAANRRETETFFDEGRYPLSVARWRQHVRKIAKPDPPSVIRFAVCLREDGRHIGTNGLWGVDRINRTAETESFFHGERGAGYGSEAKQLLLAYAFDTLGLNSVYSWVWGPNTRSAAALIKQGYREAGRASWGGTKDGEVTFARTFDFLADEWREGTARAAATASTP